MAGLRIYLQRCFFADLRALALMRIGLGLTLLYDVFDRWRNIIPFYTSAGIAPASDVLQITPLWQNFSFFFFTDFPAGMHIFFAIYLCLALGVLLGYKTRWCVVGAWFFVAGFVNRNVYVTYGLDTFLLCFLLIGIFLPLAEYYSLDSRKTEGPKSDRYFSPATVALYLQIVTIYLNAAFNKLQDPLWRSGEAVYHALLLQPIDYGQSLAQFRTVLSFLAYFTLFAQFSVVMILLPIKNHWSRLVPFVAIVTLHLGMEVLMVLGGLPLVGISVMMSCFPFWLFSGKSPDRKSSGEKSSAGKSPMRAADIAGFHKLAPTVLVVFLLLFNFGSLSRPFWPGGDFFRQTMAAALHVFRFDQRWDFFSPVNRQLEWYAVKGVDRQGEEWDLLRRGRFQGFDRYIDFSRWGYVRWPYFFTVMSDFGLFHQAFSRYTCREAAGLSLQSVEVYEVSQEITRDGRTPPLKPKLVFRENCRQEN